MSFLYRPQIVTYTLPNGSYRTPDGKRVESTTRGAVRTVTESKTWYGRWTDGAGRPQQSKLSESKDIARRMLAKLSGDSQLASVGIEDKFAEHRARPLLEHLEDFRRYLTAKGSVAQYVRDTCQQVGAIIDGCDWAKMDDLQASAVVEFLATLREREACPQLPKGMTRYTAQELGRLLKIRRASVGSLVRRGLLSCQGQGRKRWFSKADVEAYLARRRGKGTHTVNHYLSAIKRFSKWLVKDGRAATDPLVNLARQNPDTDLRHPRRALAEEAFGRFIQATGNGKTFRGLTGADRLVLYTLAANTGFRAGELASLTPRSFDLAAGPPTVTVQAGYSKRRRKDIQPLRPDVAEMMRQYLKGCPNDASVWPGTWWGVGSEMIRGDLAAAGLPYQDEDGRYFDFHALRGQFISLLAANGVHPKVAQELARHSSITLTMDYYTHLDVLNVAGALDKLPGIHAVLGRDSQETG